MKKLLLFVFAGVVLLAVGCAGSNGRLATPILTKTFFGAER